MNDSKLVETMRVNSISAFGPAFSTSKELSSYMFNSRRTMPQDIGWLTS